MEHTIPAGLRFSLLARAIRRQIDNAVKEDGLTGVQLFVLCELRKLEDAGQAEIHQKDLERISGVTHPTMTEILQRLEKKGYVSCERSERDRRHKLIRSTGQALGLGKRMDEADREAFAALCDGLSAAETENLLRLTDHLLENARTTLGKGCESCCD